MTHEAGKLYLSDNTGVVIICLGKGAKEYNITGLVVFGNNIHKPGDWSQDWYAQFFSKEVSIEISNLADLPHHGHTPLDTQRTE